MQNDSSVRHIAVTCPHCGKHYRKVPYDAIKKYSFAFCKQCNVKFHITAAELDEALRQSLNDSQGGSRAAQSADSRSAGAFTGAAQPGVSSFDAAPAGHEHLTAPKGQTPESAKAAPVTQMEPQPEEPHKTGGGFPDTAFAPQAPAPETASLNQVLEQKITDLAATMEETFSQPPAAGESDVTGSGAEKMRGDAAAAEPPCDICFDKADAAAAQETDTLQMESVPDFATPAENVPATPDEYQTAPPAIAGLQPDLAGEDLIDQTLLDDLNLPASEEQPAAEPVVEDLYPDELRAYPAAPDELPGQPATRFPASSADDDQYAGEELLSSILNMNLHAPEEQPAEDAAQDEFISPELTFSTPETENCPELQDGMFIETPTPAAPGSQSADATIETGALFEKLLAAGSAEGLAEKAAVEATISAALTQSAPEIELSDKEFAAEESGIEDIIPQDSQWEYRQEAPAGTSHLEQPETPAQEANVEAVVSPGEDSSEESPFAAPAEEYFEEELLDESLIENAAEPLLEEEPFIEKLLDEALVEERSALNGFYPAAGRARGPLSAQSDVSFFDSLQNADGARDVSAMLKQLVLPADDIEEGMEQFVLFALGEQTFAAPIANVFELSLPPELIAVPNTPQWILGISNVRGEIISVIDFRKFLNIEPDISRKPSRMIIAQTLDKQMNIGLMVDSINGIKYFSVDAIQPLEQQGPGLSDTFFQGACLYESEVVIFLNLEQILQSSKMRQFQ